jgi:hypothetical protein
MARSRIVLLACLTVAAGAGLCALALERPNTGAGDAGRGLATPAGVSSRAEISAADRAVLDRAQEILVVRCMAGRGFDVDVPAQRAPRIPAETLRRFRYVIDDVDWAVRHGYGMADQRRALASRAVDAGARRYRSLSEQRR